MSVVLSSYMFGVGLRLGDVIAINGHVITTLVLNELDLCLSLKIV